MILKLADISDTAQEQSGHVRQQQDATVFLSYLGVTLTRKMKMRR
jgi:hypothetical protein